MKCKICNQENKSIFSAMILNKYNIKYYHCARCNFLQTEEPYWLDEVYKESINTSDTGYMQRNLNLSKKLTILLSLIFNKNDSFLDYAGGYGVFTRLMRDIGFNYYWDDKYTINLFARGFEYSKEGIDAITTFESFEHFINPLEEIEKMLQISKTVIFSTELLSSDVPETKDWWYYGLDHGQHISFYNENTFQFIANKYGLNYYNLGSLQLLTNKNIPQYVKLVLKFSKFRLHEILQKQLKSKTWSDHLKMSNKS